MTSKLFSPFRMRGLDLANRIVVSPMAQYSAEDGNATTWHLMHLGNLAISGAGLLILEATSVNARARFSLGDLGLYSDENEEALAPIVEFCRRHGSAKLGIQLQHAGRKGSSGLAWNGQKPLSPEDGGWIAQSPDDIPYPGKPVPERMSIEDIKSLTADFVASARRADRLGFDLIELHAAHGYLLHNFLSPLSNQRDDDYGGNLDNRMRFVLEVFDAVRAVWPEEKPLGMRLSATDWAEGGWALEDTVVLSERLKARGCDYVTASSGGTVPGQEIPIGPGYQVPLAARVRQETGIPTMAIGLITEAQQAEDILDAGQADLICLARAMLFNPRWPWHAALELGAEPAFPPQYERAHPAMRGGDFLTARQ